MNIYVSFLLPAHVVSRVTVRIRVRVRVRGRVRIGGRVRVRRRVRVHIHRWLGETFRPESVGSNSRAGSG